MALLESVERLSSFKDQLDDAWKKFSITKSIHHLNDLNFIAQVFAVKVSYITTDCSINFNQEEQREKATKTP